MILEVLESEEELLVADIRRKQSAGAPTRLGNRRRDYLEDAELSKVPPKPKESAEKSQKTSARKFPRLRKRCAARQQRRPPSAQARLTPFYSPARSCDVRCGHRWSTSAGLRCLGLKLTQRRPVALPRRSQCGPGQAPSPSPRVTSPSLPRSWFPVTAIFLARKPASRWELRGECSV